MYSLPSLISLATTIVLVSVLWFLPLMNLHLALTREYILIEKLQTILDQNRLKRNNLNSQILAIQIPGIEVQSLSSKIQGDYEIYDLSFKHNDFFYNQFLSKANLTKVKRISLIMDLL